MYIKKAIQLTAVIIALATDHYMANAVPKFTQIQSNKLDYDDEIKEDNSGEGKDFNSEFKDILSPLNRIVVPPVLMDTSELTDEVDEAEWEM